jgi:hypothetical protein
MADVKISGLPASTVPLAGTEVLPIVQGGVTKQVSVNNLTAGKAIEGLGLTLTSTDAGASQAPTIDLYRDSASPAASDTIGEIEFNGEDSAGNKQAYALFHGSILSPTSGAEQGQLHFETATAGALTEKMIIGTTNLVINEPGNIFNVRIEGDTDANLFYTDATNSRVGVGTSSPATKLDVNGTVTATGVVNSALTSGRVTYAGTSGVLQDNANFVFDASGNVGIGTATPAGKRLYVLGGAAVIDQVSAGGSTLTLNRSSNPGSLAFQFNGTEAGQIAAVSGGGLDFYRGSSPVLAMNISSSSIVTMSAYGAGTATFSAAGVISSVSDETWKTKDGAPTNVDAMIQKLEPGYWYYNNEKKDTFGADRQLGFYAQNVHEAIGEEAAPTPEKYKDENGNDTDVSKPWGYYDRSVLAVTVMSLKNALSTIEELKSRLTALENK